MRQSVRALCAWALVSWSGAVAAEPAANMACLAAIAGQEKAASLPPGLLLAIALVESGRPDPATGRTAPWPWTLNVGGAGHFYAAEAEAIRDAAQALARDQGFVDVGCMQIDLFHHPRAFPSLSKALDPATNVAYAATYLRQLEKAHGSWPAAIGAYHAGNPDSEDAAAYLARVLAVWQGVARGGDHHGFDLGLTEQPSGSPPVTR